MRDRKLWTWHIIAGLVVALFLGLHMIIMHLNDTVDIFNPAGGHPVDWSNMAARAKSICVAISYVLLLGAALYHGLYGLRNILFELGPSARARKVLNALLLLGGVGFFGLGTWAAFATYGLVQVG